jgi:predicted O-methyltransferase YrrM
MSLLRRTGIRIVVKAKGILQTQHTFWNWQFFLAKNRLPLDLKRGDWSMHIQDFKYIIDLIKARKDPTIFELGAGVSTLVFSSKLSRMSTNRIIISIEADMGYAKQVQDKIIRYGFQRCARIYYIPYEDYGDYKWFNEEMTKAIASEIKNIDLLIVDAPPDTLCPYSRRKAIPFFLGLLKSDGIVILHDAKRQDETIIAKEWRPYFSQHEFIDTPLGLAVFRDPVKGVGIPS